MKDGTQVQQHCRNSIWLWSRLANLLFHPSSSELLAVSSLAWQVWYSGVCGPGSLFLFYFVSCNHASFKIGTSPPCNWAKHSWWKSAACWRCIFLRHHFVIGVCLVQTITSWRRTFLLLQQVLKQAPSAFLCVFHTVTALIITTGGWLSSSTSPDFVRPKFRKNQIAQLLSKVTVNCALWTQLTLRLHPRHCDTNIFPMSQSAKYNLVAGWAGHRIKRTGWEHSMGLTLVLVAIHLCRITSSFPKRQADQEILRQVRLSLLKNFASFATKLYSGEMFECMWCKTIMSHPSSSTLFPYHSTRFFCLFGTITR